MRPVGDPHPDSLSGLVERVDGFGVDLIEHPRACRRPAGSRGVVYLAALDDIVASKQHANRDKDRVALAEL